MDHHALMSASAYRVEHHQDDLAPLLLSLHHRERTARTVASLAMARYRVSRRPGWIVMIHQAGERDEEVVRLPIQRDFTPTEKTQCVMCGEDLFSDDETVSDFPEARWPGRSPSN